MGAADGRFDPLAFDPDKASAFERRAAAGFSQVLYAKTPGGATATARRTASWRREIGFAAARSGVDADTLEAVVFLESAGRPDAVAGGDVEGAAGLTQIVAETAANLLGLRVDVRASRRLTRRIEAAVRRGDTRSAARLRTARRRVDGRFEPARALAATGRYLDLARQRFGRDDLALASYHMGIGNLEGALRAYADDDGGDSIAEVVKRDDLSYARLYFDSTPLLHAPAYSRLAGFGDDSATYLWRVRAARDILRLYRQDPARLRRLQRLHDAKSSAEEVLHPRAATEVYGTPGELERARAAGRLVPPPPASRGLPVAFDRRIGELASRLGRTPMLYRALRPEALALLLYLGAGVDAASGEFPLIVTSAVRDEEYQRLLATHNGEASRGFSLHTTGYAFDILRAYRSRRQALAFEFWLTRLQALNLIAWAREPAAIHITVSSDARTLLPFLARLARARHASR